MKENTMRAPTIRNTPWGGADYKRNVGRGITFYGTPSHGGFFVPVAELRKWPAPLRAIVPFAGRQWFEEDCDWAIVVAGSPDLFEGRELCHALESLRRRKVLIDPNRYPAYVPENELPDPNVVAFFATAEGEAFIAQAEAWHAQQVAEKRYRPGSAGTFPEHKWSQFWNPYDESLPDLVTVHDSVPMDMPNNATRAELEALGYEIHEREKAAA
jgi:hypothetical protein